MDSILNIVMLGAAAGPHETIVCILYDFSIVVLHYAPQSAALEVGMRNECCMFNQY